MKFVDEYHRSELACGLVRKIHQNSTREVRFMEFCGGHTVTILKHGIRQLLPATIEMLSGPGCPVCVTDDADLDKAIALAQLPGVILTTFGDMLKVPGSNSSLEKERARGADIRILYSALDSLRVAKEHSNKKIIFLAVGFETTAPTIALTILAAKRENIKAVIDATSVITR